MLWGSSSGGPRVWMFYVQKNIMILIMKKITQFKFHYYDYQSNRYEFCKNPMLSVKLTVRTDKILTFICVSTFKLLLNVFNGYPNETIDSVKQNWKYCINYNNIFSYNFLIHNLTYGVSLIEKIEIEFDSNLCKTDYRFQK